MPVKCWKLWGRSGTLPGSLHKNEVPAQAGTSFISLTGPTRRRGVAGLDFRSLHYSGPGRPFSAVPVAHSVVRPDRVGPFGRSVRAGCSAVPAVHFAVGSFPYRLP